MGQAAGGTLALPQAAPQAWQRIYLGCWSIDDLVGFHRLWGKSLGQPASSPRAVWPVGAPVALRILRTLMRAARWYERERRTVSPVLGARVNAAESWEELACTAASAGLDGLDLARVGGPAAGLSRRRAVTPLETELWDVFPGRVGLLDRGGVLVSANSGFSAGPAPRRAGPAGAAPRRPPGRLPPRKPARQAG